MSAATQGALSAHLPHPGNYSDSGSHVQRRTSERTPLFASPSPPPALDGSDPRRPRSVPLLQLVALGDLVTTLTLAVRVPIRALPPSAVALNLGRPVLVGTVLSTRCVRDMAPVLLGQVVLSALVLLFRLNELVQKTAAPLPALSAILRNPTTAWYLASFAFSLTHYALFAAVVGVRRRRAHGTAEVHWDGVVEHVRTRSLGGQDSVDGSSSAAADDEGAAATAALASSEDDAGSSDDQDDIIDVPSVHDSGTLRHRASRASLLSAFSPPRREGDGDRPGLKASRGYGSIRSLAGI
ncbi:hypothetical protein JCM3770_001671 [Rhodotorula araucariae]